jgi:trehalose 6-phosphate synthase/phosphatase
MASNRLPVNITEQDDELALDRSIGGVATALDAIYKKYDALWVGWTGLRRTLSEQTLRKLRFPKRMIPVQADADLVEMYYDRVTNRVLWPAFHNIKPRVTPTAEDWEGLRAIATRFADAIKQVIRPGDVIWVHDYHLILVPSALRRLGITNRIGYFWHTPFPDPKHIFALPYHEEILDNMYELDLLGLQTERDVDTFWECMRQVGSQRQPGLVRSFPIGIDFAAYHAAIRRPAVRELSAQIKQDYAGKRMIFSISRLDYTKGITNQVRAVARFFESLPPAERKQFVYKLVVAPSREDVPEYSELRERIDKLVTETNDHLGTGRWKPIEYAYQNFGFADMAAWYGAAEVLLLLPKTDGMNLIAKEFVACQHSGDAVLVLSKNTGSAAQLQDGALLVDPADSAGVAKALERAFAMPRLERTERWERMLQTVSQQDVFWWADRFLTALRK